MPEPEPPSERRTKRGKRAVIVIFSLLAAGCGDQGAAGRGPGEAATALFRDGFKAVLIDASGKAIGSVTGTRGEQGLDVHIAAKGLKPGDHGMHFHEAGRCDLPAFASAGAHWNAAGRQHGHDNPRGPHDGDLGNLTVGADGEGSTDRILPRYHARFPPTGLSLVLHASPDDERTDPSGNSGARIACAVVLRAT
jgi:Cu-Zn family superoxide dismutase